MYHKLGRPKRTVKAQIISIQEPGNDPIFYRLNDRRDIVEHFTSSKNIKSKIKVIPTIKSENNEPKSEKQLPIEKNNQLFNEKDIHQDDNENIKLIDINYFLNKKPFPSINDFDIENILLPNPFILVS